MIFHLDIFSCHLWNWSCAGCLVFPYSHQSMRGQLISCVLFTLYWDRSLIKYFNVFLHWLHGEPRQLAQPRQRRADRIWSWPLRQSCLRCGNRQVPNHPKGKNCMCAAQTETCIGSVRVLHYFQCPARSLNIWLGNENIKAWNKTWPRLLIQYIRSWA